MNKVELLNYMGDDKMVVNAARVSLGKWTDEFREKDVQLINYLAKHNHITPFFHPQLQFRFHMPIFVERQWFKSVVGLARNSISRRYVTDSPQFFLPDYFRPKDENVKQGSKDEKHDKSDYWLGFIYAKFQNDLETYNNMLKDGIAPEMARMVLPFATYTEFIETGSLYAYARIYNLRSKPDAQKEIQWFANEIGKIISEKFPYSWKALTYDK